MQEDVRLLLKSIEEASKHARTTLLILVATCIYVVSASYSVGVGPSGGFVALPLLGPLPISVFLAVAPAVVLCVYAYLHLYVGELLRRLRSFDQLPDLDPTPPITRDQL